MHLIVALVNGAMNRFERVCRHSRNVQVADSVPAEHVH